MINYHSITELVNSYAMCVTYLTKFIKQTIFPIRHFYTIKYRFKFKQQNIKSFRADREIKIQRQLFIYR